MLTRQLIGNRKLKQVRGQAIALHSKAITDFCNRTGIPSKERQAFIRMTRDHGKTLGLLA
ncbi:electron transporter [Halomicronema sp. CCY15110]|uniref:cyclic electron transport protein PGR5 n=1 Tax=Halomicronema sp. CCY15110 TaxID=2767773 RepID=UPI001EF3A5BF|nr:electron transporter [Halomicronema sp. CCY15110]